MKPKLIVTLLVVVSLISLVQGAVTYLDNGQCYNFTFQEGIFNETSNQADIIERTETFCSNYTDPSLTTNRCSLTKILKPGEQLIHQSAACDLNITSALNVSTYEHEIPIFVEGEDEWIKVTIGTETQSFPRYLGYFNYESTRTMTCPFLTEPVEGDPQSLRDCLAILKETKDMTSEERDDYKQCITTRDDFKVEWEKRGIEMGSKEADMNACDSDLKVCIDKKQGSGLSNVILIIIVFILLVVTALFIVLRIRERSHSVEDLA